jgi:hypothetical protein
MPEMQKPSVGRIVHYVAYGTPGGEFAAGVHRAAIITEVGVDGHVGLAIMNPTGMFFSRAMPHSEALEPGTWHWPETVTGTLID